jgi:hypothetical protein
VPAAGVSSTRNEAAVVVSWKEEPTALAGPTNPTDRRLREPGTRTATAGAGVSAAKQAATCLECAGSFALCIFQPYWMNTALRRLTRPVPRRVAVPFKRAGATGSLVTSSSQLPV